MWYRLLTWTLTILLVNFKGTSPQTLFNTVRIPGFFDKVHEDVKNAFIWTFGKINLQSKSELLMAPNPHVMDLKDSFRVSKRVCMEIEAGAKIIFGPSSTTSSSQVQAITSVLGIPHIQFHQDADDVTASISGPTLLPGKHHMTLNLFPSNRKIIEAHRDLVHVLEWTSYTVIYDDFDGLIRLQDVLLSTVKEDVEVIIRELDEDPNQYGKMLKAMRESAEYKVIIDCDVNKIETFLQKANETGVLDLYSHFHFTTLDLSLVNLNRFLTSGANITAFSIVSKDNPLVKRLLGEWKYELFKTENNLSPLSRNNNFVSTDVALVYDAVQVFDKALGNLRKAVNVDFDRKLHCNRSETWDDGTSLINYMKTIELDGMTGKVHFGKYGLRDNFDLDILKLGESGLETIGVWTSIGLSAEQRVNITKTHEEPVILLGNRTLRVVTKTDDPYVFDRERNPDGSIKYTGFVIDILDLISERLNFKYEIVKNADSYGSCDGIKKCTGMMKELVQHNADIAAAGMTITSEREEYVDFTKPFKNLGITILIKKPKIKPPNLFSFLDPFHPNVWMFMVAGFICVTIMLFISARFSPYEWNPEEGSEESDTVVNQFSISNSVWFTIGCILQQGSDLSPLATSTRTVAVVWWFFTLILISSYTANLAAFLTVSRMDAPIDGIDALSKQSAIKYGTLKTGSTHDFFKFSKDLSTTYAKVWNFMKSTPGVLVPNSKDGIQKVLDEDYAFFAESTSVEYHVQRKCQLMQVGGELNSIGYGLALPNGSPYLKNISMAIIQLNEEQEIDTLYKRWWKELDGGGTCPLEEKDNDIALKMENVAGVFVVLIGGCCAAVLVAICEFLWVANKNARRDEQSFCSEVCEELRFILPCLGLKPRDDESDSEDGVPENTLLTPL